MKNKNILEMFASIQGEGLYIGIPSIFIRFAGCNLKCDFCDTKYSWNEEGKYSIEDVITYIKRNLTYNHLVLTGGEPLLYQDDIIQIHHAIHKMKTGIIVTIETNGTIEPNSELEIWQSNHLTHKNLWSVSPKLQYLHITNPLILQGFNQYNNVQWKFVINDIKTDIERIQSLITSNTITPKESIILQPNGLRIDYNKACKELAEYVIENNLTQFRVLPQFHRMLWEHKRGV